MNCRKDIPVMGRINLSTPTNPIHEIHEINQ